ncbi:hypothetical protein D915_006245 [Fasciola hepatica]|uniref:Uncharacterized protein n=1 Tax=Fasciola hepatica TaxID=6192 RepID=A0A2H1C7Z4_FASHE|nr:hypothetical protein D915_006245 [Fasciola hepatica]
MGLPSPKDLNISHLVHMNNMGDSDKATSVHPVLLILRFIKSGTDLLITSSRPRQDLLRVLIKEHLYGHTVTTQERFHLGRHN